MKAYNEIKKELEARKDRSAWNRALHCTPWNSWTDTRSGLSMRAEKPQTVQSSKRGCSMVRTPGSPTATAVPPSSITGTLQNGFVARLSTSAPVRVSADLTAVKSG